jgi:hypothetical protein
MTTKLTKAERESESLAQRGSAWAIRLYARNADESGKFPDADLWCIGVVVYRDDPFRRGYGVVMMYAMPPVYSEMPSRPVVSAAQEPLFAHLIVANSLIDGGLIHLPNAEVRDMDKVMPPRLRTYSDVFGWRASNIDPATMKTMPGATRITREEASNCIERDVGLAAIVRKGATCAHYGGWKWFDPPRRPRDPVSPDIAKYYR